MKDVLSGVVAFACFALSVAVIAMGMWLWAQSAATAALRADFNRMAANQKSIEDCTNAVKEHCECENGKGRGSSGSAGSAGSVGAAR